MDGNMKILLTASLNVGASVGQINEQIKAISKLVDKIDIKLNVDSNQLNSLKQMTENINRITSSRNESMKQTTNVINEQIQAQQRANQEALKEQNIRQKNLDLAHQQALKENVRIGNLGGKVANIDKSNFTNDFSKEKANMEALVRAQYGVADSSIKLQRILDNNGNSVWKFTNSFKDGNTLVTYKGNIDKATGAIYDHGKATKELAANMGVWERFKVAMSSFPVWMGASTIFFGAVQGLKSVTQTILEVDTAMTNLKKVMSTDTNFEEVFRGGIETGKEFAKTITEVLDAYEVFARQGYKAQDMKNMADAALIASNVGEIKTAQAAEYLTSAIVQFKKETTDAMDIVDAWNNISNKNATTVEKLAQGTAKAGSTAKAFGVDMHELNAIVGTVTEATKQSGNEVGNFVKTVLPRLNSTKAQDALQAIGVAVRDSNGDLRKAVDIYGEVAKKMETMTTAQKTSTAEALSNKFHLTRMLALLQNWDNYEKMLSESINSKNSALNENQTYMQSMAAKINLLKADFQELAMAIGKAFLSDSMMAFVGGLRSVTQGVIAVIDKVGVLPILFGAIGIAISRIGFGKVFAPFLAMIGNVRAGLQMIYTDAMRAQVGATALGTGFNRLGAGMLSFFTLAKSALISTGIGIAFVALGFAVEKLISHFSRLREEEQKATEQAARYQKASEESLLKDSGNVETLVGKYKQLQREKDSKIWNTAKEKEYQKVTQDIANIFPNLIDYIDEKGQAHLIETSNMNKVIASTKEMLKLKQQEIQLSAKQRLEAAKKKADDAKDKVNKSKKESEKDFDVVGFGKTAQVIKKSELDRNKALQQLANDKKQLAITSKEINKEVLKIADAFHNVNIKPSPQVKKAIEEFVSALDLSKLKPEQLKDVSEQIGKSIDDITQAFNSGNIPLAKEKIKELIDSLKDTSGAEAFVDSINSTSGSLDSIVEAMGKSKDASADFGQTLNDETGAIDDNTDAVDGNTDAHNANTDGKFNAISASQMLYGVTEDGIKSIENAIHVVDVLTQAENLNEQQKQLLAQATQYLSGKYPELNGMIAENIDYIKGQVSALSVLNDTSASSADTMMANEYLKTTSTIQNTNERLKAYQAEMDALNALAKKQRESIAASEQAMIEGGESRGKLADYNAKTSALDQTEGRIKTLQVNANAIRVSAERAARPSYSVDTPYSKASSGRSSGGGSGGSGGSGKGGSGSSGGSGKSSADKESEKAAKEAEKEAKQAEKDAKQAEKDAEEAAREAERKAEERYRDALAQLDLVYKRFGDVAEQLDKKSQKYREQIQAQIGIVKQKIAVEQTRLGTANHTEAESNILDLTKQIRELNDEIEKSTADEHLQKLTDAFEELNYQMEKSKFAAERLDKSSNDYSKEIANQITLISKKEKAQQEFIKSLEEQNKVWQKQLELTNDEIERSVLLNKIKENTNELHKRELEYLDLIREHDSLNKDIISNSLTALQKKAEDYLNNQIKLTEEKYDKEISAQEEKLKLLDEEIAKEDRLQKLQELNDEIQKTKSDKRFEYINKFGQVELTYDKAKVSELEKQRDELVKQYGREDAKKAIQDNIDNLRKKKDEEVKILQDALEQVKKINSDELKSMTDYVKKLDELNLGFLNSTLDNVKSFGTELANEIKKINELMKTMGSLGGGSVMSGQMIQWIKEKAESGKPLDEYSPEKQQVYDLFKKAADLSNGFDPQMVGWIRDKAIAGIPLDTPTAEKQALYDAFKKLPKYSNISSEMAGWIKDKADTGRPLDTPTPEKQQAYDAYKKANELSSKFDSQMVEWIRQKALNNIPLDIYTPEKRELYEAFQNLPKYHDGGVVGGDGDSNARFLSSLFNLKPNEQLIKSLKGEVQIPPQNVANGIKNIAHAIRSTAMDIVSGKQSTSSPTPSKIYNLYNAVIKADNPLDLFNGIDHLVKAQQ
ncbi:phage tail tape measure protein [Bacillus sp. S13(2024)]|uniref:phage tail tape measure protein n=1 Tax=Bacillus sp. S13(2024) TaxID=3162885 RepID=UPI003D2585F6